MADVGVSVILSAKDQASREIHKVSGELGTLEKQASRAGGAFGGLRQQFAAGLGIGTGVQAFSILTDAVGGAIERGIDFNAQMQTTSLQFETLMGDADQARDHVKALFDFAAHTPFESGPIIKASKHLQTFGGDALNTRANLTLVGDAAAALGTNIDEVAFWFGRAYTNIQAGRPFGEAAMRLQELGVLSGEARNHLEELQEAGASNTEVFAALRGEFGKTEGAMAKQASTWKGLTSTLSDFYSMAAGRVTAPVFADLSEQIGELNDTLESGEADKQLDAIAASLTLASRAAQVGMGIWASTAEDVILVAGAAGEGLVFLESRIDFVTRAWENLHGVTPDTVTDLQEIGLELSALAGHSEDMFSRHALGVQDMAEASADVLDAAAKEYERYAKLVDAAMDTARQSFIDNLQAERDALYEHGQALAAAAEGQTDPFSRQTPQEGEDMAQAAADAELRAWTAAQEEAARESERIAEESAREKERINKEGLQQIERQEREAARVREGIERDLADSAADIARDGAEARRDALTDGLRDERTALTSARRLEDRDRQTALRAEGKSLEEIHEARMEARGTDQEAERERYEIQQELRAENLIREQHAIEDQRLAEDAALAARAEGLAAFHETNRELQADTAEIVQGIVEQEGLTQIETEAAIAEAYATYAALSALAWQEASASIVEEVGAIEQAALDAAAALGEMGRVGDVGTLKDSPAGDRPYLDIPEGSWRGIYGNFGYDRNAPRGPNAPARRPSGATNTSRDEPSLFDIRYGRRQHGGPVRRGQPYMVGEGGPEPFIPSENGTILPNGALGGRPIINVNLQGSHVYDRELLRRLIRDEVQNASRTGGIRLGGRGR